MNKTPPELLPSDAILTLMQDAWNLSNLTFVRKMENIVFACDRLGEKVFLRLTSPLRRTRQEIEAELNWIKHLATSGIPVPKLIPDNKGNEIVSMSYLGEHFEAVLFAEITGVHPSAEIVSTPKFLKTLGALIAKMHNASRLDIKREEWNEERGLRHALTAAAISSNLPLRTRLEEKIAWMHSLPRTHTNYGLIHADLGALNLFVNEEHSISVIDFDDSCFHWFAFDLAIVLYSMTARFEHVTMQPSEKQWLVDLVDGYRTVRPFSEEQVALIPEFMDYATLRVYFWIEHHEALHTFHKDALQHVAKMKSWAQSRLK